MTIHTQPGRIHTTASIRENSPAWARIRVAAPVLPANPALADLTPPSACSRHNVAGCRYCLAARPVK